jgi:hypothetical protein
MTYYTLKKGQCQAKFLSFFRFLLHFGGTGLEAGLTHRIAEVPLF